MGRYNIISIQSTMDIALEMLEKHGQYDSSNYNNPPEGELIYRHWFYDKHRDVYIGCDTEPRNFRTYSLNGLVVSYPYSGHWDDGVVFYIDNGGVHFEPTRAFEKQFRAMANQYIPLPNDQNIGDQPAPKQRQRYEGFLYLLRAVMPNTYYKIGLSKNPKTRIGTLGVQLPFPIEALHIIPTNDMKQAESQLHERYESKRVNGEWFELSDEDVQEICAIEEINL